MKTTLTVNSLQTYIENQIDHFIPDGVYKSGMLTIKDIELALQKIEKCFSHIRNDSYSDDAGNTFFSHLHADQYATLLVILACDIWKAREDKVVCDRLMYLWLHWPQRHGSAPGQCHGSRHRSPDDGWRDALVTLRRGCYPRPAAQLAESPCPSH